MSNLKDFRVKKYTRKVEEVFVEAETWQEAKEIAETNYHEWEILRECPLGELKVEEV
tara:strand:+ start:38 stop:208 length:171 start_codon:yes stop_codon:yes gene_type:complete